MGNQQCSQENEQNLVLEEISLNSPKHFIIKSNYAVLTGNPRKPQQTLKGKVQEQLKKSNKNEDGKDPSSVNKAEKTQIMSDSDEQIEIEILDDQQGDNSQEFQMRSFKTIDLSQFIEFRTTPVTDHYNFYGKIDSGAFGDVYRASSKIQLGSEQQLRAIKAISDTKANLSIMKQINMLKSLDHPHILKIYQIYRYNKMVYIVTEFLPGGNLMQLVSRKQKYSEYFIAMIMKEILGGLVYLHLNHIIHRDLKPQNIMFQSKPNAGNGKGIAPHAKIIDFGISIQRESGKPVSGMVGTPYFMAPEVLLGCYDEKCDIWSCGIMLYFMLCGSLPFKGRNNSEIFKQILYSKPTFKQKEWSMISKSAISLLKNMLNKKRSERYSAKEVLQSEWIKNRKTDMIDFQEDALDNLRTHEFKDNFTAIVKTYIASMTTSLTERRIMAQKFKELDQDQSGFIDRQELKLGFEKSGIPCPNLDTILTSADTNKSGKIDFTEFITAMSNQETLFAQEKLGIAFEYLDSDHTGYIQVSEIMHVLKGSTQQEIDDILSVFDKDRDNKISKNQFVETMIEYAKTGESALDGKSRMKHSLKKQSVVNDKKNQEKIRKGTMDLPTKVEGSEKKRISNGK